MGVDAATAAKTFATALADPAKGIQTMEEATGAYSLKTQDLIKSLVAQGEAEKARAVMIFRRRPMRPKMPPTKPGSGPIVSRT